MAQILKQKPRTNCRFFPDCFSGTRARSSHATMLFSQHEFLERTAIPVLSGAVAGNIEICITYPLEFAKNSMQVQPGKFRSLFHAVRYNVAKDGFFVLYRGLPSWLLFAFPRNAVRFTVFENVISHFDDRTAVPAQITSGLIAGAFEAPLCLVPMQVRRWLCVQPFSWSQMVLVLAPCTRTWQTEM